MDVVDTRLYTGCKIGESKFSATPLMIFLYKNCYGRGDSAMQWQQKNVEAWKPLSKLTDGTIYKIA